MSLELLGLLMLALLAVVGAASFYAGYCSAQSYLLAAKAVSAVANSSVEASNSYSSTLDGVRDEMQALKNGIEVAARASEQHDKNVEDSLLALFQGLERAGLARPPRATARQVGEAAPDS